MFFSVTNDAEVYRYSNHIFTFQGQCRPNTFTAYTYRLLWGALAVVGLVATTVLRGRGAEIRGVRKIVVSRTDPKTHATMSKSRGARGAKPQTRKSRGESRPSRANLDLARQNRAQRVLRAEREPRGGAGARRAMIPRTADGARSDGGDARLRNKSK